MKAYNQDRALARNFWLHEVRCKCGQCPGLPEDLAPVIELAQALQSFRDVFWNPLLGYECRFLITSWFRCPAHNQKVDGRSRSQHLSGNGADTVVIRPNGGIMPAREVAMIAHATGLFTGIIAYPKLRMTHLDRRKILGMDPYFCNFGPFADKNGNVAAWEME